MVCLQNSLGGGGEVEQGMAIWPTVYIFHYHFLYNYYFIIIIFLWNQHIQK